MRFFDRPTNTMKMDMPRRLERREDCIATGTKGKHMHLPTFANIILD